MRILERRPVAYHYRVKNRDVRCLSHRQHSAVAQSQLGSGHGGHLAHAICQRDNFILAHVLSQYAWERAVSTRVRLAALACRQRQGVGANHHLWVSDAPCHVFFRHHEHDNRGCALFCQQEVHHGMGGVPAHGRSNLRHGFAFKLFLILARRHHDVVPAHRAIRP